eukprot:8851165-Pyramimonas_sp.AAC.1
MTNGHAEAAADQCCGQTVTPRVPAAQTAHPRHAWRPHHVPAEGPLPPRSGLQGTRPRTRRAALVAHGRQPAV